MTDGEVPNLRRAVDEAEAAWKAAREAMTPEQVEAEAERQKRAMYEQEADAQRKAAARTLRQTGWR